VIKVSDDDLRGLFPGIGLDAALQRLRAFNPSAWCLLTRGGEGASLFHGARRCDAHAPEVAVVDTVGAGDASVAGLLPSLARDPLASKLVALAEQLKAKGVAISFDPNFRNLMDERYTPTLQRMAALADLIKVSDDDLRGLFPGTELDEALRQLRAFNPDALCLLTRGGEGASLLHRAECADARAPKVDVVDTVGAGDASAAGLLQSLARYPDRSLQSHLHAALAAGSAACLQAGATPPPPAAMHRLFEQLEGDAS
jgi:sugar/nucleoside kinase (ribokinase family)